MKRIAKCKEQGAFIRFTEFAWFTLFARFSRFALLEPNELSKPSKLSKLFALCFLLFMVGGCATNTSTQYIRQNIDYKNIQRMAVLPFESLTNDEYAGENIRKPVINHFLLQGVRVCR